VKKSDTILVRYPGLSGVVECWMGKESTRFVGKDPDSISTTLCYETRRGQHDSSIHSFTPHKRSFSLLSPLSQHNLAWLVTIPPNQTIFSVSNHPSPTPGNHEHSESQNQRTSFLLLYSWNPCALDEDTIHTSSLNSLSRFGVVGLPFSTYARQAFPSSSSANGATIRIIPTIHTYVRVYMLNCSPTFTPITKSK
jgi:hypothetical protein